MLTLMCIFSFYQSVVSLYMLFKVEYQSNSIPKTEIRNYYKDEFHWNVASYLQRIFFVSDSIIGGCIFNHLKSKQLQQNCNC